MEMEKPEVAHFQFRLRWRGKVGTCTGRSLKTPEHLTLQVRMQTPEGFLLFEVAEVASLEAAWPLLLKVCSSRGVEPLEYRTTDGALGAWALVPGVTLAAPGG
ncbi:MAG: hypothetical protein KC549_07160 [Myxococcales bacterium]|nr:hypothetical protein [Myxococcales bacterium]MCB9545547.1 hypothetical protein [Myxococcales bacterium]